MTEGVRGVRVGVQVAFERQITREMVDAFILVSGDTNPLHSDPAYAARTRFREPIAHGLIGAGLISAAIATRLTPLSPGSVMVYLSQNLQFRAPVYIDDTLTATATVTAVDPARSRVTLATTVTKQDGTEVIRGEATVLVDTVDTVEGTSR